MWETVALKRRTFVSPCKVGTGKRRHHCSPAHAAIVTGYHDARHAQYLRAEAYGMGYATETAEFYSRVEERITFKRWLIMNKGMYATQSSYMEAA